MQRIDVHFIKIYKVYKMNVVFLQDDFYLNLVDWSGQNILSVGLGTCVYLWSACTSQVVNNIVNSNTCSCEPTCS